MFQSKQIWIRRGIKYKLQAIIFVTEQIQLTEVCDLDRGASEWWVGGYKEPYLRQQRNHAI